MLSSQSALTVYNFTVAFFCGVAYHRGIFPQDNFLDDSFGSSTAKSLIVDDQNKQHTAFTQWLLHNAGPLVRESIPCKLFIIIKTTEEQALIEKYEVQVESPEVIEGDTYGNDDALAERVCSEATILLRSMDLMSSTLPSLPDRFLVEYDVEAVRATTSQMMNAVDGEAATNLGTLNTPFHTAHARVYESSTR